MTHSARTPTASTMQGFPRSLLDQPASVRLDYFKNYTVIKAGVYSSRGRIDRPPRRL